jgi:hypothetical protein
LTGSYDGPPGQREVTGSVTENRAVFGFEVASDDGSEKRKATYTATIESATKISGTVEFSPDGSRGKWTATKK